MEKGQTARVRQAVARAATASAAVTLTPTVLAFPLLGELVSAIASGSLSHAALGACDGGTAFVATLTVQAVVRAARRAAERIQTIYGRVNPKDLAELTESRHEIMAAFEIEHRHIERDFHDGAQQYLVTTSIDVGEADLLLNLATAGGAVAPGKIAEVRTLLGKAQNDAESALRVLRNTVAGIHPEALSDLELEATIRSLAASSSLKVEIFAPSRLPAIPEGVIVAAYFLVSRGLANIVEYTPAVRISVLLAANEDLHVSISDDSPGGTNVRPNHGLSGMHERLATFGGVLEVVSPPEGPTTLTGWIPLLLRRREFGVVPVKGREGVGETGGGASVSETGDDTNDSAPETRRAAKADWQSPGEKTRKE